MSRDAGSRIVTITAVHNRMALTAAFLSAMTEARHRLCESDLQLDAVVVDDGSSDGTEDMISTLYPWVQLLKGSGDLFWGGATAMATEHCLQQDSGWSALVLMNDDVTLAIDEFVRFIEVSSRAPGVSVGPVCDPESGDPTYSGLVRSSRWHPLRLSMVHPAKGRRRRCDTFHGNCVYIPRSVIEATGGVDPLFRHSMGDTDLGLRITQSGTAVEVHDAYIGTAAQNDIRDFSTVSGPLRRVHRATSLKGYPPGPYWTYCRRHGGRLAPLWWIGSYLRAAAGV